MRKLTVLLPILLIAFIALVYPLKSNSGSETETGISFHQGTWKDALKMAEEEGKPIFLNISASWCGPCKKLKATTFHDEEVGRFYNANFINVMVDGEKGEGIELARKYEFRRFPSLIFIDSSGEFIAQTAGYRNPEQFVEIGKVILNR